MSDTPRTNTEAFIVNMTGHPDDMGAELCMADFARELERELNEAKAEIEAHKKRSLTPQLKAKVTWEIPE